MIGTVVKFWTNWYIVKNVLNNIFILIKLVLIYLKYFRDSILNIGENTWKALKPNFVIWSDSDCISGRQNVRYRKCFENDRWPRSTSSSLRDIMLHVHFFWSLWLPLWINYFVDCQVWWSWKTQNIGKLSTNLLFSFFDDCKSCKFQKTDKKGNLKLKVKYTRMYSPRTHKQDTTLVIIFQTYKRWNHQKRKKDDKRQLFHAYFGCHNLHLFAWRVAKKFIEKIKDGCRAPTRSQSSVVLLSSATRIKIATITKNTCNTRKNLSLAAVAKFDKTW